MSQKKKPDNDAGPTIVMVWTTVGRHSDAQKLATDLVENRLAACVQIDGPVTSTYRWQASVETEPEVRLLIKTSPAAVNELHRWFIENHPYDEPELVVTPVMTASPSYAQWVIDQTSL